MKLRVKILSLVGSLCVFGFAALIILQQLTIAQHLKQAETNIATSLLDQNTQKQIDLERFLKFTISDSQVRTNMLLAKIRQYPYVYDQFLPTPESSNPGTWFSAASTLMLNPWLDFIQVENEGKVTSMYSLEPPYASGFWHFTATEGVEIFAKYDSQGNIDGPYIGIPVWIGSLVDYSQFNIPDINTNPGNTNYWMLFYPDDILKFDISKIEKRIQSNPIKPLQIGVWVKNDEAYQALCQATLNNMKKVHEALLTPQAKDLYKILDSDQDYAWLKSNLDPLKDQIKDGESTYEKLEKISISSLDNTDIFAVRYEEMSRKWDEIRFIWEVSALFLSGMFGEDMLGPNSPDGLVRCVENEPKGVGFVVNEATLNSPFQLFDPTGISGGFETDVSRLNGGIGIISNPTNSRLYVGNRLQLNYLDPLTQKNRSGSVMVGIDAAKLLQRIAIGTQDTTYLVVGDKVLAAYSGDGSVEKGVVIESEVLVNMKKYTHGITQDAQGNRFIFFRVQPYQDMDMELFVFRLRQNELTLLEDLGKQIDGLLYVLNLEMYIGLLVLSIALIVLIWYSLKSILRPLSTLADAVEKVGTKDFEETSFNQNYESYTDEIVVLFKNFEKMLVRIKEGEQTKMVLHKFLDPSIAHQLLTDEKSLHGKDVLATVFFLDFRKFTQSTEQMPAEKVVEMLNLYFNQIVEVLKQYGAVIDKFVGDAVLALWGVPQEDPKGPFKAVQAAIEIQKRMQQINQERIKEKQVILEAAIGIHYATVTEGIMGSKDFSEFTVIGSQVNIASRVCDEALANEILITTNVYDNIIGQIAADPTGEHHFEGVSQRYALYRVHVV
jgi:class 3 adenylate cyclase